MFYLPASEAGSFTDDLSMISGSIVGRIGDLTKLLSRMIELSKHGIGRETERIPIDNVETGEKIVLESTFGEAQELLAFMNQKGQPIEQLHAFLRTFTQLFYPSENAKYNGPLAYYRQREWRLVAGFSSPAGGIMVELNPEEKKKISEIDSEYFGKMVKGQKGDVRRIDICQKLKIDVLEEVSRIIIPKSIESEFGKRFPGFPKDKVGFAPD